MKPLPARRLGNIPAIDVGIDGHDELVCAIVDTGANTGIALPAGIVSRYSLPEDPASKMVATGVDGLRHESKGLAPLRELRVGAHRHKEVLAATLPLGIGQDCGALGMQVLSGYRLIFDLGNDRIWFLPSSHTR